MRRFASYGPIDTELHYYTPRSALIATAYHQLVGDDPNKGGHYITVWAPRQTGKTWIMQQVIQRIQESSNFEVAYVTLQSAKSVKSQKKVLEILVNNLCIALERDFPMLSSWAELATLFSKHYFTKPVILILDEFDALSDTFINQCVNEFRTIYSVRQTQNDKNSSDKAYLLHGLALIGVRSALGVENVTGSPFNIQRSLHIPNLTLAEVARIFQWYEQESGQTLEQPVVERLYDEFQGQPGLTCWMGELLTETYNKHQPQITLRDFEIAYTAAIQTLPNNNILNVVSKAKQEPYKQVVLELYKTDKKMPFHYDNERLNFLYLNGVITYEVENETEYYVKFASPFVQKRLFNYFADAIFPNLGQLHDPFADLSDTITPTELHVSQLMRHYEAYLQKNGRWLLKNAPRRNTDERLFEAVYHFNLYLYLVRFLESYDGQVIPEFPTGNGKIDLLIRYAGQIYGLEVKSFASRREYEKALAQAAHYAQQLRLAEIALVLFIENLNEENRQKYETLYTDPTTGITVRPVFVITHG